MRMVEVWMIMAASAMLLVLLMMSLGGASTVGRRFAYFSIHWPGGLANYDWLLLEL